MADPGAQSIMALGVDGHGLRSHPLYQLRKLFLPGGLRGSEWSENPDGALEQAGIRMLDAAVFLACHGMPGQKTLCHCLSKNHFGSPHDLRLGAAHFGQQRRGLQQRTDALDQFNNGAHWGGQDNQIAARDGCLRTNFGSVNGSHSQGLFQNLLPVAADDRARQPAFFDCQPERPANQAGADDSDLVKFHGTYWKGTWRLAVSTWQLNAPMIL